jgi:hypothetical protein
MPTLVLSSSYNTESKILRKAAQDLNWETFRFEGDGMPKGYERRETRYAIYCTVPKAFTVARQLDSILMGCSANWLPELPETFSKRKIDLLELRNVAGLTGQRFIKPALGKSFDAAVSSGQQVMSKNSHLPPNLLVHASEIVEWETEYRCFAKDHEVMTLAPYRRDGVTFSSYESPLRGPRRESEEASEFAHSVLQSVPCPGAFVLDVGIIKGRGWAVVEPNECWGAGIYGCTPSKVLEVLLAASVPKSKATKVDLKWDYAEHYFQACPHMKNVR